MYAIIVCFKKNRQKRFKVNRIDSFVKMKNQKQRPFQRTNVYKFEPNEVTTPYIIENLVMLMEGLCLFGFINNKLFL